MEIDGIQIKKAASVGAGVIGYSYALKFAMAGLDVWAQNRTEESSELARERVAASLESLVKNDVYTEEESAAIAERIHYTTSIAEAVAGAQFIQESSAEHYEVKWELVKEIEAAANPDAIVASSTSGLLVTEIAKNAKHPERFCGGHPVNTEGRAGAAGPDTGAVPGGMPFFAFIRSRTSFTARRRARRPSNAPRRSIRLLVWSRLCCRRRPSALFATGFRWRCTARWRTSCFPACAASKTLTRR